MRSSNISDDLLCLRLVFILSSVSSDCNTIGMLN
jgi:hypothetical protein